MAKKSSTGIEAIKAEASGPTLISPGDKVAFPFAVWQAILKPIGDKASGRLPYFLSEQITDGGSRYSVNTDGELSRVFITVQREYEEAMQLESLVPHLDMEKNGIVANLRAYDDDDSALAPEDIEIKRSLQAAREKIEAQLGASMVRRAELGVREEFVLVIEDWAVLHDVCVVP